MLFLEICRGRTRHPHRPVVGTRFLIGADASCDLRLGGREMPPLHSVIHADGAEIVLEAVVPSPPLLVNGRVVESVLLHAGDRIEIGPFALVARIAADSTAIQRGTDNPVRPESHTSSSPLMVQPASPALDEGRLALEEGRLEDLSAMELIDLIEQEESQAAHLEAGRRRGADALLHALGAHLAEAQPAPPTAEPVPAEISVHADLEQELHRDVEHLLKSLNEISQELEQRSTRLSQREASYAEAAAQLLDLQHNLATQLDRLLKQLESLPAKKSKPTRAVA